DMLIDRQGAQVLMIDVQERLAAAMPEQEAIIEQCQILLRGARALAVPTLVSEQYPRGLGPTVVPLLTLTEPAQRLEKLEFSCLRNEALAERLRHSGRKQLMIAGLEAHVCVLQTALDALEQGFTVFVVANATGSRRLSDKTVALDRIAAMGGRIVTTEMVIFEWLGSAAAAEFKALSALVR
ncbi:MAG TPA: hydrolase, partial [Devosia sp.]|nr:hydrolase [Devosia sp.]